jgi:hypothetical protein
VRNWRLTLITIDGQVYAGIAGSIIGWLWPR